MPFEYLNKSHLVHSTDRYEGLWTITELVPRTHELPTVRLFVPSSNQTTNQTPLAQAEFHPRRHHRHHHRHQHRHQKFM